MNKLLMDDEPGDDKASKEFMCHPPTPIIS